MELVAGTTTETGLRVLAEWDQGYYPTGTEVTNAELAALPLSGHSWRPNGTTTLHRRSDQAAGARCSNSSCTVPYRADPETGTTEPFERCIEEKLSVAHEANLVAPITLARRQEAMELAKADGTQRSDERSPGTLFLVPTPIGHPDDITLRAIQVLRQVAVVASEDTRHTRRLLQSLEADARLLSYHDHNEETRSPQLLGLLLDGTDVALVSDAGTPLVNDPGYRLVAAAIEAEVTIRPLPGATAPVPALVGSGLPNHQFHYVGFLPRKQAARRATLTTLRSTGATLIFFEAPHRIVAMLTDLGAVLGDRPAALARNLSKDDEEFFRGRLDELTARLDAESVVRGQFTVVVAGAPGEHADEDRALAERLTETLVRHGAEGRLVREVVREVTGLPRNWVYEQVRLATERSRPGTMKGGEISDPRC